MARDVLRQGGWFHVFDTALGTLGLSWRDQGLVRLRLPDRDRATLERRLAAGGAEPATTNLPLAVGEAVVRLRRYAGGERVDFAGLPLDLGGVGDFDRLVYEALLQVGWGETVTYGELARRAGSPGLARAIGQSMGRNPLPIIIPCHRVLATGSRIGGFSAPGGTTTKQRLLALEGVDTASTGPLLRLMEGVEGRA
jgi:methylated-DNA-[protein]-cysteine S-methyltransferase